LAVTRSQILMFMIASFASGGAGILLALSIGDSSMLIISTPGFVIGAFFAAKYALFEKTRQKEEAHRRSRSRHKH
jgi:hypothetical protein